MSVFVSLIMLMSSSVTVALHIKYLRCPDHLVLYLAKRGADQSINQSSNHSISFIAITLMMVCVGRFSLSRTSMLIRRIEWQASHLISAITHMLQGSRRARTQPRARTACSMCSVPISASLFMCECDWPSVCAFVVSPAPLALINQQVLRGVIIFNCN